MKEYDKIVSTYYGKRRKKLTDYATKHHQIWHHITMQRRYLKPTKKGIENSKDRRTRNGRGHDRTTNPGVTWKPDNPLKGTRNQIHRRLDNPLKGIWNLVPNVIRIQWPRGLDEIT